MATSLGTRPIQTRTAIHRPGFTSVVALVSVAASLVSLAGSWIPSFWGDEAASVMSATRSLPSLFAMLPHVDAVHGTYYLGLHFWIEVFGASPFSVRFPSAVAVGATVAAVMIIARRLGTTRIAVAAGIICAVIPRVTYMGAETRSSAFAAAIVAWLTVMLLGLLERQAPSRRRWIAYGALLAIGIYVFLYVGLIAIAHALILLSVRAPRPFMRRWAKTVGIALACSAPVILFAVVERGQISFLSHRNEISPGSLAVSLWFGTPLFAALAWTLLALALVPAISTLATRHRRPAPGQSASSHLPSTNPSAHRMPRLDILAACWLLVPSVILIGTFPIAHVYTARYLSYCAPAAALLMAIALDWAARHRTPVIAAALVIIALCAAPVWFAQRQPTAKNNSDFAQTAAIIAAHSHPGDAIAFDESVRPSRLPRLALHLYPAFDQLSDVTLNVPYDAGTSWHDTAYSIADASTLGRLADVHRLWLIEYAHGATVDTYDRSALAQLGFTVVHEYPAHRSVTYEYVRS